MSSLDHVRILEMFSENVKKKRKELGLTQAMLAKRAECHLNVISNIERGIADPKLVTAVKISRGLKTTLNELTS